MILTDSHIHTSYSPDSKTSARAQVGRAVSLGLTHMTFTDHYDPEFIDFPLDFTFDIDEYFRELTLLKEEFAGRIDIGIGVELGAQPHIPEILTSLASGHPFDFVINSTHIVKGMDPYYMDTYLQGRSEAEGLKAYFEEVLANLQTFDDYDVAGHIDYAVRYLPSRITDYDTAAYADVLEEILRTVIGKGKGIEINTAGLKAGLSFAHPHPAVLKRYRELGGEIVTVGSDAHNPEQLGKYFDQAAEALSQAGFKYYTVFRGRKPVFLPLDA